MKSVTVEIIKDEAIKLLEELQRLNIIRVLKPERKRRAGKNKFQALRLNTRGFKFNREEANER